MPKPTAESLEAFLQRQPASALTTTLLELADDHEAVRQRDIGDWVARGRCARSGEPVGH